MPKLQYWLVKSEPSVYPYRQLVEEGHTDWTGVRNFEARNNLRGMREGDLVFFYHSNEGKEIVGVAKVAAGPTADPTAPGEDWASVELAAHKMLEKPVSLATLKQRAAFNDFQLISRSRLSVIPVTAAHFKAVLSLAKAK